MSLLRAAIVSALLGHWLANALFDREQYAGAGSEILGRLDEPFLVQAALAFAAVVLLTIRDRRRRGAGSFLPGIGRVQMVALLVGVQLVLFVGMETTERLAIDVIAGERADVAVFGTGFLAEFAVAIGSALLLALLGETSKRILELLRPGEGAATSPLAPSFVLSGFASPPLVLAGSGGVRAPPSI